MGKKEKQTVTITAASLYIFSVLPHPPIYPSAKAFVCASFPAEFDSVALGGEISPFGRNAMVAMTHHYRLLSSRPQGEISRG